MGRIANSIRNTSYGAILQIITLIISFITRTLLIRYIGIEALSINGLFSEVITALSLAELGIGASIGFNLYKPLAENNKEKICQLMNMYKTAYHTVAVITLFLGVILCPWIHCLVNTLNYSISYIRLVYLLFVFQLASSYLFSYRMTLLNMDQKSFLVSKATGVIRIIGSLIQIIIIPLTRNYIYYLVVVLAIGVITNIYCSYIAYRTYPYLNKLKVTPLPIDEQKNIFSNTKNIFIKAISFRITNSTDNILISTLVSTILIGYYSNYALVFSVFRIIAAVLYSGICNSMGNMMATETNEKCERMFKNISYIFYILALISSVCTFSCITPFITVWLGKDYLLDIRVVFVCCVCLFIELSLKGLWMTMEVSGLFSYDKYSSIAGAITNLLVSIVLGIKIGMAGIFIGTCCSYLIQVFFKGYYLYKTRWGMNPYPFYWSWIKQATLGVFLIICFYHICNYIYIPNQVIQFIVNGSLSMFGTILFVFLFTRKTEEFQYTLKLFYKTVLRKETSIN